MQKRGLIESIAVWDSQRDLRNDAGHIYFATDTEYAEFHNALAEAAPAVANYARLLSEYAKKQGIDRASE